MVPTVKPRVTVINIKTVQVAFVFVIKMNDVSGQVNSSKLNIDFEVSFIGKLCAVCATGYSLTSKH